MIAPVVSIDKNRLDIDLIHQFLNNSYWAKGRTKVQVQISIDHSMCFGLYLNEEQIGFARVITDTVVFAYLMDVFIVEQHQGRGYAKQLLNSIFHHQALKSVGKWFLATQDAHDLYRQFNFVDATPNIYMERKT